MIVERDRPWLSSKERIHFGFAVQGLTSKEAADQINCGDRTVKLYRSSITRKVGAHSIAGAIRPILAWDLFSIAVDPDLAYDHLDQREYIILYCASFGLSTSDIAGKFNKREKTVKNYKTSTFSKLHANNIPHAIWRGFERGILELPTDPGETFEAAAMHETLIWPNT